MKEYGYMENGYLRSRFIDKIEQKTVDKDGVIHVKVITEEEQIAELSSVWKPVDEIDHSQIENADDGYIIVPVPYDGGDHIGYNYVLRRDKQAIETEIQELKDKLADSDYKITKCYEASLVGTELPYDVATLHAERQSLRDRINELEATL